MRRFAALSLQQRARVLAFLFLVSLAGLQPTWAGEIASEIEYIAIYGKFGDTPLLILAQPRGTPLTIRLGLGLRQAGLDSAMAARLLSDRTPTPVEGFDGVTIYTVPGVRPYDLSYPQGSRPVLRVNDPSESPGTGGHDGGGEGGSGGSGGCSCS